MNRPISSRSAFLALFPALVVSVGLSGCGRKSAEPSAGRSGEQAGKRAASGGTVPLATVKSCAGFSTAAAAEILGIPAADLVDQSQDLYETLRSCSFGNPNDSRQSVIFSLSHDESVEEATAEMASLRSNLELAQNTPAGTSGDGAYSDISGLGDEALWTAVNGTLNVRRGNIYLQIISPSDKKAQIAVAEKVLAGLR